MRCALYYVIVIYLLLYIKIYFGYEIFHILINIVIFLLNTRSLGIYFDKIGNKLSSTILVVITYFRRTVLLPAVSTGRSG